MDPAIRSALLDDLQRDEARFGPVRIRELAEFLKQYAERELAGEPADSRGFARVQYWNALSHIDPAQLVAELVETYRLIGGQSRSEMIRLEALVERFAEPVSAAAQPVEEFAELRTYAQGMGRWGRDDVPGAAQQLGPVLGSDLRARVGRHALPIPASLRPTLERPGEPPPERREPGRPYRILSLDAGGVRSLLTAILLERLENLYPGFVDSVDLFAGVSAGGILALGLAAGYTPGELRKLYEEALREVFASNAWRQVRSVGGLVGARYEIEPFRKLLLQYFGDRTLGDLQRQVLVTSIELDNKHYVLRHWQFRVFHNLPGAQSYADLRLVDAGLRTCATPTYFPVYQGHIDGGLAASNPSLCALAQALDWSTGGHDLRDVTLLSLGSGRHSRFVSESDLNWGWARWAAPLIEIMLEGATGVTDFQCRQVLGDHYWRLDPILREAIDLDDVNKLRLLTEIAAGVDLSPTIAWLDQVFTSGEGAPTSQARRRSAKR
jgi:predicted acylesterase/phospholipase RssA